MTAPYISRWVAAAAALVLATSLTACGSSHDTSTFDSTNAGKPVIDPGTSATVSASPLYAAYAAADSLLRNLGHFPDLKRPILVATLVNINDLQSSSAFGRMTSEQIGSRLANSGLPVAEIKLREAILVEEGRGELMLSRDARNIARARGAQALVVGTYATGRDAVYVNVRLVSATDGRILSSHDYVLPMTRDVAALINSDINAALGVLTGDAISY